MPADDSAYLRRRAAEEWEAARAASRGVARQRHLELAYLYRRRSGELHVPASKAIEEPRSVPI